MSLSLVAVALAAAAVSAAAPVAEPITAANAAERLFGGPDAIGGVGDWYLANDLVQVIVDDPSRRYGKLNHGGTIVDAGVRGRGGDDQLAQIFPIVNLDQRVVLGYDTIRAEVDPDGRAARLVVSGRAGMHTISRGRWFDALVPETDAVAQVFPETVYEVRAGEPFVRIATRLENRGSTAAPLFSFGEVWMRGGRGMRSFVGNTRDPARSRGFRHRGFDRDAILAAGDAMADFTFVAMAGVPDWPPIAYALAAPERVANGLSSFGVTGEHVSLVNAFLEDPGWDAVGVWRILLATRGELSAGETWTYERRLFITPGRDVAASTDLLFPALGFADGTSGVAGRVEPPGAGCAIHVGDAAGSPVTQIAPAPDGAEAGRFRTVLPPGDYVLTVRAPHVPPQRIEVAVPDGGFAELPPVRLGETGFLRFAPAFADGGPGRVIATGIGGTPDPVFRPELLGFEVDGRPFPSGTETRELLFVGNANDPEQVAVAPGRYRLTATRGPEFGIAQVEVEVPGPGATAIVPPFEIARAVELPGWLSADLHVHAEASDDSAMSNAARLRSYAAELVDVMVTTDHDNLGWFEPALDALDLRGRIRVVQGVEATSAAPSRAAPWTLGHHNAWPIPYRETAHRHGAPPTQELTLADLYGLLRRDYGARVVQLNHALPNDSEEKDGAFLSHLGSVGEFFDPALPLEAEPNRALLEPGADGRTRGLDFDAIEVMNGAKFRQYRRLREVWYSLLRQGVRRAATGNSDTHGPDEVAGYPRNYVALPGPWQAEDFDAAIREGRLFATTGPVIRAFRANGGEMGDVVAAPGGRVEVEIEVAAAPWVPVDEVRLLVDGELARVFRGLEAAPDGTRLVARVDLALLRDGFVTLEAGAPLDADEDRWIAERAGDYAQIAQGFVSQALANPIWIDVDGDGRVTPPGLETAGAGQDRLVGVSLAVLALGAIWFWLRARAGLAPRRRA